MVKKFIIAVDTNIHIGNPTDEYRHFMFTIKKTYDTIEEAEARLIELLNKNSDKHETPFYYTIIPIYIKN